MRVLPHFPASFSERCFPSKQIGGFPTNWCLFFSCSTVSMQQRGYNQNASSCFLLLALTVVMSISNLVCGLEHHQTKARICGKGETSDCHQSQFCGIPSTYSQSADPDKTSTDETFSVRVCLCCRPLNSSAAEASIIEECDLSHVVGINGSCYNRSAYNDTKPPMATPWDDGMIRDQPATPPWIISLPCVGGGLIVSGSLIYLLWCCRHKGDRLCRKAHCVGDPEKGG